MNNLAKTQDINLAEFPEAVQRASQRIAPAWPLDTAIAVNPWWSLRDRPFRDVAAKLEALGHVKCLMPKDYYLSLWETQIQPAHLETAAAESGYQAGTPALLHFLDEEDHPQPHWHNFSELLDALPEHGGKMLWRDEIIQQISQFCGMYFQYPERLKASDTQTSPLYSAWLDVARHDLGIEVLMGEQGLQTQLAELPDCPRVLCQQVMDAFGFPETFDDYTHALLLDIHGWASWLAYTAWQDGLNGDSNHLVEELLAIRLAWEWVLWRNSEVHYPEAFAPLRLRFLNQFKQLGEFETRHHTAQTEYWVWQRALEISYQNALHQQLESTHEQSGTNKPVLQAAFCIDVRSEPMRRALEAQHPDIETIGFAGFFGLPLEYAPGDGNYRRPQLPGLLKPQILAKQACSRHHAENALRHADHHASAFDAPPASLGLVEMLGAFKSIKLLKNSLWPASPKHPANQLCDDRPFELSRDGEFLTLTEKAELAQSVLTNMGLTENFAPTVLLLAHGSRTQNNPQAAALDCGACGGQTGEVNVKVLAQLLNDTEVRRLLAEQNLAIPSHTRFVAGLHNTTTDEIQCYGAPEEMPWQNWLASATQQAQQQRAATLNMSHAGDLDARYQQRSRDWSEIRPEWGLANNAAFIVAPRALTRSLDLGGRTFLHDYQWQQDTDFATLELIMTAPMIVTNWINLQYYASTVDNRLYGSGNKLLHNVVGEHIGVFEGNGGDLRIGLAKQSLHDGKQWRHQPVRLSVYIAAPRDAISSIVAKHDMVAQLINNDWLYLYQWNEENHTLARLYQGEWQEQAGLPAFEGVKHDI